MQLDGRFRFDNFVVGSANRLAVAAARAVAEAPGHAYSPLFIYGASGLGKTHLLGAIGNEASALHAGLHVDALSLDEFVRQLHAAVSVGQAEAFRRRYDHADILLIDDVQLLTGRRETQTELLRICQSLQEGSRQVVLTSDRAPAEIADVDERLITRLGGGLVVDIGAPDYETRAALLATWCQERPVECSPGALDALARLDLHSVRELQAALTRVVGYRGVGATGRAIEAEDVQRAFVNQIATRTAARSRSPDVPPESAAVAPPPAESPPGDHEYLTFLSDVAHAVARHVDPWRTQLAEAAAYWSGEGYHVGPLDRALRASADPGVDAVLHAFVAAVERLRALEGELVAVDPAAAGSDVFRDPERVADAEALVAQARAGATPPPGPSPMFTRERFEVGTSNELAVRAADTIVSEPGRRFNPLFLHGPSGVGKTHLLHAIGNRLRETAGRPLVIACVGAQELIDELVNALRENQVERWRSRYRLADAMLIDDVQFLSGKERTQEELFHTFNDLHAAGKQIVLSSDRAPRDLAGLEGRLRSRFAGGLVTGIQSPDRDLRERLYARYLDQVGASRDDALATYLADVPAESVREILGVVNQMAAAADLAGLPLSLDVVRQQMEGPGVAQLAPPTAAQLTPDIDPFFLDAERVVWEWPEVTGRVIEEWR